MRRILVCSIAAIALIAAATAIAAGDSYTATTKIAPSKGGTAAAPVPISLTTNYKVTPTPPNRAGVLLDIKNSWAGLQVNGNLFPVCTAATINAAQSDKGCKASSLVGTGSLTAVLGPHTDPTNAGAECDRDIKVYNGGKGKLVFTLAGDPAKCLSITFLPAFEATYKVSGGKLLLDAPIPRFISHPLGLDGSLKTEVISYKRLTKKVKGKVRGFFESVSCKGGKRAYKTTFKTATQTSTVPGTLKCSK